MIITRAPLRITLGGGGTDLPAYYRKYGGYCLTAAINKYVYIAVSRPFAPGINLKYSQIETVEKVEEVEHPIIRAALQLMQVEPQIDIVSLADIPAGTGLGSSSSFTVALIAALAEFQGRTLSQDTIAKMACHIEMEVLKEPIGKQDQYATALGGVQELCFYRDDSVEAVPLKIPQDISWNLEDNLLLFYTGLTRDTRKVLKPKTDEELHLTHDLGAASADALRCGDIEGFCRQMRLHWGSKRLTESVQVNRWYDLACDNGAQAGKIVGAGGGGFLLFYSEEHSRLRKAMSGAGLSECRFWFDRDGVRTVLS